MEVKITKVVVKYVIKVINPLNEDIKLKTEAIFYFNDGTRTKTTRLNNKIEIQKIDDEEKLNLINECLNSKKYLNFTKHNCPQSIYELIDNLETEVFTLDYGDING